MTLPLLPRGIERDETVHGRIYFTKAQMLEYGKACAEAATRPPIQPSTRPDDSTIGKRPFSADELMEMMGMK